MFLGGYVAQLQPWGQDGTLLSVDQHDLNSESYPSGAASGGTFLVESDKWLSPSTYQPKSVVTVTGAVAGEKDGLVLLKPLKIHYWEGPRWGKWDHPVPPEWYGNDPSLEYWFTPPYFNPWLPGGRR